jgi:hypothetical protein
MPTSAPKKKIVKKTVKKATVKKAAPKKTAKKAVKKEANFKAMVCAFDGECFWSRDGRILENLADLKLAFGSMDDEIFLHHVEGGKNDFADWVENVLQDPDCAQDLRKTKKRTQAEKVIADHLRYYNI